MPPIPVPESYTLPYVILINRIPFIAMSVIFVPLIVAILYVLALGYPSNNTVGWVLDLLIATGFGLFYTGFISHKILLSENKLSCRQWFFTKEMEYANISGIRYYSWHSTRGIDSPMLELSGNTGEKITINLLPFVNPVNLSILYDVLKKNAHQADIRKSREEFFSEPDDHTGI